MSQSFDPESDLNTAISGQPSILKQGHAVQSERNYALLTGFRTGLIAGVLLAIIVAAVMNSEGYSDVARQQAFLWIIVAGVVIGPVIRLMLYYNECRQGFLRIDDDNITWWTLTGLVQVPMEKVFGAGPERFKDTEVLRVCRLDGSRRGFESMVRNFSAYDPVSGPVMSIVEEGKNGCQLAREVIYHHIGRRIGRKMPVAECPPFVFEASINQKVSQLYQSFRVIAEFRCDGKTFHFSKMTETEVIGSVSAQVSTKIPGSMGGDGVYEFPVRMIKTVDIIRGTTGGDSGAYTAWVKLDPSTGHEDVNLNLGYFSNAREIDRYIRCLPTLFPEYEDSGFWQDSLIQV